ncbi:MAG: protein tyrosine phosphatase family protein [Planctomycetales bacterium]|nr:protein tyrosine phosphatase family protein [Planctomycetales bacterium]
MKRKLVLIGVWVSCCAGIAWLAVVDVTSTSNHLLAADEGPPKLEACKIGKAQPSHRLGNLYLAGQPQAEDFQLAKEQGIKTVLNLRKKEELTWDEEAAVKKLGLTYINLPFASPAELKDEVFDQARKVLRDKERQPLLLHCASANRVGAIWLAHRVLDDKVPYEQALDEARKVGLKAPPLEEAAKNYISRVQTKK